MILKIIIVVITFLILGSLQFIFPIQKPKYKNIGKKKCTQHQPFRISKEEHISLYGGNDKTNQFKNNQKYFIICNFNCDGNCQYKGMKYFKTD